MILHVVLFAPRGDLSETAQRELLDGLGVAARAIGGVRRFEIGRRIRHGLPGYEQAMRDDYSYALTVEVESVEALKAYLAHPAHVAIGRHFTASAARALAYDYEMFDARAARITDDLTRPT
jgi:stress responsive alpha/beta barrel protein